MSQVGMPSQKVHGTRRLKNTKFNGNNIHDSHINRITECVFDCIPTHPFSIHSSPFLKY